jgi:predicted phosphate transport protein (TIGR00153 family)
MPHKRKHKFDYFDAFEDQAKYACKEAKLLVEVIENYTTPDDTLPQLTKAHEIEHDADEVCHEVFDALTVDFVPPIERGDIIALTQGLDDIIDYMEGTLQRFYMLNVREMAPRADEFARLLLKNCETLKDAMADFRNFKKSKKVIELAIKVGAVEEEADQLFFTVVHDMYAADPVDPIEVAIWSLLFQRLENTADACEHVADSMRTVIMKNS